MAGMQSFYFQVFVDWNRDGFGGVGTIDDITAYTKNVELISGMASPNDLVAAVGTADITVHNGDKRFSPGYAGSPYYGLIDLALPVRIDATDERQTYTIFVGYIDSIKPTSGVYGARESTIHAIDGMGILQAYNISLPLQRAKTSEYLLKLVIDAAYKSAIAANTITLGGNPANNDTIKIDDQTYTFKTTLTSSGTVPNEVLIGSTPESTIDALYAAVAGLTGAGTLYGLATSQPANATAAKLGTYRNMVLADYPVRYYRLGEAAGTTAVDSGTNSRNATYVNAPTLAQPGALRAINTSTTFDGINDHVSVPTLALNNQSFSLEAWIRTPITFASNLPIFAAYDSVSGDYIWWLINTTGSMSLGFSASVLATATNLVVFGDWNHVAYTYNYATDTSLLYLNGALVGSNAAGPFIGTNPVISIGGHSSGFFNWFKGEISEFCIYQSVLTAAQIAAHYATRSNSENYAAAIKANTPVRYYRLGESSGTAAIDEGSARSNGTYTGGPTLGTNGPMGYPLTAVSFDGTNDYLSVPTRALNNQSFTIEAWFRLSTSPNLSNPIFAAYDSVSGDYIWLLARSDGYLSLGYSTAVLTTLTGLFSVGEWNHVAVTYDFAADLTTIYLNGSQIAQSSVGPFIGTNPAIAIGGHGSSAFGWFKGEICEVALFNSALSAATIAAHYANETNSDNWLAAIRASAPVRYYRMAESSGTAAIDYGSDRSNGTYTSGPTLGSEGPFEIIAIRDPDTAVTFDGTNDYVDVPTLAFDNRPFTIEAWIKPNASPPASQMIMGVYSGAGVGKDAGFIVFSSGIIGWSWDTGGGTSGLASASGVIPFGVWSHVAVTYNYVTNTTTLYVNGASVGSNNTGPYTGTNPDIKIGSIVGFVLFKGDIDEVAIYLSALSAAQIAAHYAARTQPRGIAVSALARGLWGNVIRTTERGTNIAVSSPTLAGGADYTSMALESALRTIDTAADSWRADETTALDAVSEVVSTERGFLWYQGGNFIFKNGDYQFRAIIQTPVLTLSGEQNEAEPTYVLDEVMNQIRLEYRVRTTLTSGVIARANGVVKVPGRWGTDRNNPADDLPSGGSTTIKLPYVDQATGQLSGAVSVVRPLVPYTDFEVNEASDGSLVDYTGNGNITFSVAINGADIEVTIKNTALGIMYITLLQVRGVGIVSYDPQSSIAEDITSQTRYGRRAGAFRLPLPVSNGLDYAESLARYLLDRYKNPAVRITNIAFNGQIYVNGVNLFGLRLGDMIVLTDPQLAISNARHLIVGIQQSIGPGKRANTYISFTLYRLDDTTYCILDDSTYGVLDSTARVAI